jgi:signal transduction histidine kinase
MSFPALPLIAAVLLLAGGAPVVIRPDDLPYRLSAGWEEAEPDRDGHPPEDDPAWRPVDPVSSRGPLGGVRWYRIRVDLSACRGLPLAFSAPSIRDVDEAWLDGVRIGGLGRFPPRVDAANLHARLYALPTDVTNLPGAHTLQLRVYHGPRDSSVFRAPPSLDRLAYSYDRARLEQTLAFLAGAGLTLAAVFTLLFFVHQRRELVFLDFAAFSLLLVVYLLSGHSAWSHWQVPRETPFRVAAVAGALLWLSYFDATRRLLGFALPRRFRAYAAGFIAYAVLAVVVPDIGWLVVPTRLAQLLLFVCLIDLVPPTVRTIREGRAGAAGILVGYVFFAWGARVVGTSLGVSSFYALAGIVVVLMAVGLYTVGLKQVEARVAAVLEERSRIARNIHDTIAQDLVAVSIQLESVDAAIRPASGEAFAALGRARDLVKNCLAEARRSIWELRPMVERPELGLALRQAAQRLTEGTKVRTEIEVLGQPRRLAGMVESNLLRIGEEAVANVVKHASATCVRIGLAFWANGVELSVEDDGCGFAPDPDGAAREGRFGILGMRERTQQMGGGLVIESGKNQGTRIAVMVPTT